MTVVMFYIYSKVLLSGPKQTTHHFISSLWCRQHQHHKVWSPGEPAQQPSIQGEAASLSHQTRCGQEVKFNVTLTVCRVWRKSLASLCLFLHLQLNSLVVVVLTHLKQAHDLYLRMETCLLLMTKYKHQALSQASLFKREFFNFSSTSKKGTSS